MAVFEANYIFLLALQNVDNPNDYTPVYTGTGPFVATSVGGDETSFAPGQTINVEGPGGQDQFTYVGHYGHGWVGQITLTDPGSGENTTYQFLMTNDYLPQSETVTPESTAFAVCFLEGTRIATPGGERAVEDLAIGDLVLTASGGTRAVRWIGRQSVVAVFATPLRDYPIRIAAGALEDGIPRRDLFVSPGHALLVDGLLVQAGALVNGASITRVSHPAPRFTWYHIETEDHAVILAEDAPAETFVDHVARRRFDNHAEFEALYGAAETGVEELDTARVRSARQLPCTIRERLAARAEALGLTLAAA